jgi:manganese efflux pump family protein
VHTFAATAPDIPEAQTAIERLGRWSPRISLARSARGTKAVGVSGSVRAFRPAPGECFIPVACPSYCVGVIALLVAACAVGLSNLAASIGIGISGVNARVRLQVGLVFGVFEAGMPVVGLLIGRGLADEVGMVVRWPGAILLMLIGALGVIRSLRPRSASAPQPGAPAPSVIPQRGTDSPRAPARLPFPLHGRQAGRRVRHRPAARTIRLLASGLVLSMDNLVVGFALGTYGIGIAVGAIVIGAVSVIMSLAGLELGGLIGRWADRRTEQMSGVILIAVGAAIAGGAFG